MSSVSKWKNFFGKVTYYRYRDVNGPEAYFYLIQSSSNRSLLLNFQMGNGKMKLSFTRSVTRLSIFLSISVCLFVYPFSLSLLYFPRCASLSFSLFIYLSSYLVLPFRLSFHLSFSLFFLFIYVTRVKILMDLKIFSVNSRMYLSCKESKVHFKCPLCLLHKRPLLSCVGRVTRLGYFWSFWRQIFLQKLPKYLAIIWDVQKKMSLFN